MREWYETFVETLVDGRNDIIKHTMLPGAQVNVHVSPTLLTVLECSIPYQLSSGNITPCEGRIVGMEVYADTTLPIEKARVSIVHDGKRYVCDVTVLDINII